MTHSIHETIARAIFEARWPGFERDCPAGDHEMIGCRKEARAVLAALSAAGLAVVPREASPAMIEAVSEQAWPCGYCMERPQRMMQGGSALFADDEVAPIWRAMIAEAEKVE